MHVKTLCTSSHTAFYLLLFLTSNDLGVNRF
jgi:hypothetical protein